VSIRFSFTLIGQALFLTVVCHVAFSQSLHLKAVELADSTRSYQLDSNAQIFIDSENRTSFDRIRSTHFQANFEVSGKESLTFGYLKKPIWIKLNLKNSVGNQWFLKIPAPYLAYLDYYYQASGEWKSISTGYYLPYATRGLPDTGFLFPIYFDSNKEATVFICVSGISPKNIPLIAITMPSFVERSRLDDLWYGLFFGVLLVMMLYNFIISIRLKDGTHLLYIFTILCTILVFGSASGYLGKYLWPRFPQLNFYLGRLSLSILMLLVSWFSTRFLETKKYSKPIHSLLVLVMILAVASLFFTAFDLIPSASNNLTTIATPIFLISGIICWKKGNKNASYFVAAWSTYLIGGLSATMRNSGVLPNNFWTTHLAEIGAVSETILIALALSARYSRLKKENEEAQLELIEQLKRNHELQEKLNSELERKVTERTHEIQQQNEKLVRLNLLKDKLFSIISHDIKSPLSQLSGALYLVERDMITKDEIKELMPQIRRNLTNNENFLAELLAWTKNQLEGGRVNLSSFDLQTAVTDVLNLLQPQYETKQIQVQNQVNQNTMVFADAEMIKSVIRNLIVNAIKFTNQNGLIEVNALAKSKFITLSIKDDGCGIDPERQATLFTMDIQSTRGTANEKGSGIGLLICRDFVESNGGTIWAESQPEQGSTFAFTIPHLVGNAEMHYSTIQSSI
jgi:two-component system, sensor histidine kinase LadS